MLTVLRQSVTVTRRVKLKTQQIQVKLIKHRFAHSSVCQGGEEHHNSRAVGQRQQKIDLLLPRFKTMESQYQKAIETLNNELQTNFAVLEQVGNRINLLLKYHQFSNSNVEVVCIYEECMQM